MYPGREPFPPQHCTQPTKRLSPKLPNPGTTAIPGFSSNPRKTQQTQTDPNTFQTKIKDQTQNPLNYTTIHTYTQPRIFKTQNPDLQTSEIQNPETKTQPQSKLEPNTCQIAKHSTNTHTIHRRHTKSSTQRSTNQKQTFRKNKLHTNSFIHGKTKVQRKERRGNLPERKPKRKRATATKTLEENSKSPATRRTQARERFFESKGEKTKARVKTGN